MATVAIVPSDVVSKRMLARRLGERLAAAGHHVVMLPTSGAEDDGFETRSVALRPDPEGGAVGRGRPIARWRANRAAAASIDPAILAVALAEEGVDLLIVDIEEYEALIVALALPKGPSTVVLCSFFEVWPIAGLGPNDPGPATGRVACVRGAARWRVLWARMRLHDLRRHLAGVDVDRIAVSRELARRLGVRRRLTSQVWVHPFAPKDLPMLVCNALELDVPHRPHAGVHHIGSLLETAAPLADSADALLVDMVAGARAAGRPIVLCAFGAVLAGERSPLIDRIIDVARLRPGYEFVVGAGDPAQAAALGELPNVHAAAWVPQRELLAVASAAIVHSGNATLHECVAAGVPTVVYPFAVNDQPRNAARVVRHGFGEVGDRTRDDPATIADRLDRVMASGEMRRRIDDLAGPITRYERDGVAVAIIEDLLRESRHQLNDAARTPPSS